MTDFTEVWAIPGHHNIIDSINPETGRTAVFGRTEAEVKALHPDAVRMTWEAWRAEQMVRQNTPILWLQTDEQSYTRMLEVLPPALWIGGAFLVGEPHDHSYETGAPRFTAFVCRAGRYYTANRPLTVKEFKKEIGQ